MRYTGITIGPINPSIEEARKTRELWAASFLYAYCAELIVDELKKLGVTSGQFVIPYPDARRDTTNAIAAEYHPILKRVGLYPDRIIIGHPDGYDLMNLAAEKAKKELFKFLNEAAEESLIDNTLRSNGARNGAHAPMTGKLIQMYIDRFFVFRIVEAEIDATDNSNVVDRMDHLLACAELLTLPVPEDPLLFTRFLLHVNKTAFYRKFIGRDHFPPIIEISTAGLNIKNKSIFEEDDDEETLWENVKAQLDEGTILKLPHKYIAIVTADGDNVGKLIKTIYQHDPGAIQKLSRLLSDFAGKAVSHIIDYRGEPIYAGGDDMLFFAPVISVNNQNIFTLIDRIDSEFQQTILNDPDLKPLIDLLPANQKPSLSFGLSVTYYKFPLNEALKESYGLLYGLAKKTGNKNNIAFTLQKHSGQRFTQVLSKDPNNPLYNTLKQLLSGSHQNMTVVSSLIYNLSVQKELLRAIVDKPYRLQSFFDNFYNEPIHQQPQVKQFIALVQNLLAQCCHPGTFDENIDQIYAILRFVTFINQKINE